ncbi:MAG: tricarboxylate transporter [Rhodospirillales bacterium]|nr:tricarboxylate transporter [Rhodospirillales bacterium]
MDGTAIESLLHGFVVLLTLKNILLMMLGIILGIFVGVLPGLGGPNGVALLLPLTFTMDPTGAIVLLSCIYWGALFGGAITSILFNIPGEAWSVATTFDGYPMAQQGRAGEALTAAFTASFFGALAAVLLITFLAPLVARFALRFGPPEFFAVYFLTFCSFVGMGKEARHKILISMLIGFLLAAVGMDTVGGSLRMTFGFSDLLRGFDFLVAVIGLFGLSEILLTMEEKLAFEGKQAKLDVKVVWRTWKSLPRYWATLLRSAVAGCWLGITPGGAIAASFMGYGLAKRFSRDPDSFGTGRIEGVLAPETAAHAAGTSALLPMLALGIPGSGTAAVLLGGLMIWGLQPGPLLFVEHADFVWGLIASMYLGNIAGLILVLATVPLFAAILRVPFPTIASSVIVLCAIGAYAVHGAVFDIWLMVVFGIIGYVFKKLDYPLAPLALALVLGDRAEDAFRQTMIASRGSLGVFWSNSLVGSITTLALLLLFWPVLSDIVKRLRKPRGGLPTEAASS